MHKMLSRCPSPARMATQGCRLKAGSRDHRRILWSSDAEAMIVGSVGHTANSLTGWHCQFEEQNLKENKTYTAVPKKSLQKLVIENI